MSNEVIEVSKLNHVFQGYAFLLQALWLSGHYPLTLNYSTIFSIQYGFGSRGAGLSRDISGGGGKGLF